MYVIRKYRTHDLSSFLVAAAVVAVATSIATKLDEDDLPGFDPSKTFETSNRYDILKRDGHFDFHGDKASKAKGSDRIHMTKLTEQFAFSSFC